MTTERDPLASKDHDVARQACLKHWLSDCPMCMRETITAQAAYIARLKEQLLDARKARDARGKRYYAELAEMEQIVAEASVEIAALKEQLRWRDASKEQPRDGVLQLVVAGGNYELMYKTNSKYWNYDSIPAWWMPLQDIPGDKS